MAGESSEGFERRSRSEFAVEAAQHALASIVENFGTLSSDESYSWYRGAKNRQTIDVTPSRRALPPHGIWLSSFSISQRRPGTDITQAGLLGRVQTENISHVEFWGARLQFSEPVPNSSRRMLVVDTWTAPDLESSIGTGLPKDAELIDHLVFGDPRRVSDESQRKLEDVLTTFKVGAEAFMTDYRGGAMANILRGIKHKRASR